MKSSRRSSENSRTSLNELWPIGIDSYDEERLRLALDGTEWRLRPPSPSLRDARSHPLSSDTSVAFVSALELLATLPPDVGLRPDTRVLACGDPQTLAVLTAAQFDDYLADPWTREELLYRLRRLVGARALRCPGGRLEWGRYWLAATHEEAGRATVELTTIQYSVLDLLGRSAGETIARESLLAGDLEAREGGRALDMQVSRLRSRLADVTVGWSRPPRIRSHRGSGYSLEIA